MERVHISEDGLTCASGAEYFADLQSADGETLKEVCGSWVSEGTQRVHMSAVVESLAATAARTLGAHAANTS